MEDMVRQSHIALPNSSSSAMLHSLSNVGRSSGQYQWRRARSITESMRYPRHNANFWRGEIKGLRVLVVKFCHFPLAFVDVLITLSHSRVSECMFYVVFMILNCCRRHCVGV